MLSDADLPEEVRENPALRQYTGKYDIVAAVQARNLAAREAARKQPAT